VAAMTTTSSTARACFEARSGMGRARADDDNLWRRASATPGELRRGATL
jgi:hypothetical protein